MPETAIVTTQPGKKAKKQLHGIGFPSERRKFELAEVLDDLYPDNVSDSDGEGSNIKPGGRGRVMVKSAYGKVRPLDKTGRFADRAAPAGPPPLHRDHLETKKKAMPFSYHSHKAQVTLSRGQMLDLVGAERRKLGREEERERHERAQKEMEEKWQCDPRMLPGWTVHYSKQHGKCYFVNEESGSTRWKPPGDWPTPPEPPPPPPVIVKTVPCPRRCCRAVWRFGLKVCDALFPPPPRWWVALKRQARFAAKALGCGGCCGPKPVALEGPAAAEAEELMEALGLLESDRQSLWEAFQDADWDRGGEMSTEELFSWFGEPITPFSESIFRLADMDDSGLIDFPEFVKVVCLYAVFGYDDVLKFGFDMFDDDKGGTLDEYEMARLVAQLHGGGQDADDVPDSSAVKNALKKIDRDGDGILDFPAFVALCKQIPVVISPAFRLQDVVRKKTLGAGRWDFVIWNLDRQKRVQEYMKSHHGRRPAGNYKAATRVVCEVVCGKCGLWPVLPGTFPDYVDGFRPAAATRPDGIYGGGLIRKPKDLMVGGLSPPEL